MSCMFASGSFSECENFQLGAMETLNEDISNWDVSSVTTMRRMFFRAKSFNRQLNSWDVSKVVDMRKMFYDAERFNQNIDSWNVISLQSAEAMFAYTEDFAQNLCIWGGRIPATADLTSMFSLSSGCIDSGWVSLTAEPPGPFCFTCT